MIMVLVLGSTSWAVLFVVGFVKKHDEKSYCV